MSMFHFLSGKNTVNILKHPRVSVIIAEFDSSGAPSSSVGTPSGSWVAAHIL